MILNLSLSSHVPVCRGVQVGFSHCTVEIEASQETLNLLTDHLGTFLSNFHTGVCCSEAPPFLFEPDIVPHCHLVVSSVRMLALSSNKSSACSTWFVRPKVWAGMPC